MSKLIERLEKVGTVASVPMGFGVSRVPQKAPSLLLIAISGLKLSWSQSQLQVDSIVIATPQVDKEGLEDAKAVAGDTLWGLWPETLDGSAGDALKEGGADFFVVSSLDAPAEVLAGEEMGKILCIPVDLPEELGRSLEGLPIDAVILAGLEEVSPLSVKELLQVRSVRDLTSSPLLLLRSQPLNQGELSVLRDIGIQAIVLDMRVMKVDEATRVQEAIRSLPPRKATREPVAPMLPRASARAFPPRREEEEEEEEEEEDY